MSAFLHTRRKMWRWPLVLVILLAFAWRTHGLGRQSLWRDEVDAIYFALQDLPALLSMFTDPGQSGSLYFLALRPWLQLVGTSEFALRFASVIAGVVSIPLLWQVGRLLMPVSTRIQPAKPQDELATREVPSLLRSTLASVVGNPAFLATLLFAANPYQLWYAQEGKMYALATFMAILVAWFWLRAIGRGGWQPWLGLLATVSLAIYIHLLMVLLVPLLVIWFLVAWPQSKFHRLGFVLLLAGLALPYVPLVGWQWPLLTAAETTTALSFIPLEPLLKSVLIYQNHGILPPASFAWLVPFLVLALIGLLLGFRPSSPPSSGILPRLGARRRHLLVASWLIVPIASIYLLSLRQPVFLPRYVIWVAPALMLLTAVGIKVVWQNSGKWTSPLLIILLIYVFGYWGYIGWQEQTQGIKADLRGAVRHVFERRVPGDLLILQIPHLEYSYRYYSSDQGRNPFDASDERLGRWAEGPWTNNSLGDGKTLEQIDEEMRNKTEGASEIWVIRSEADMWDASDLMGEWLDENATLLEATNFQGAEVRAYRK